MKQLFALILILGFVTCKAQKISDLPTYGSNGDNSYLPIIIETSPGVFTNYKILGSNLIQTRIKDVSISHDSLFKTNALGALVFVGKLGTSTGGVTNASQLINDVPFLNPTTGVPATRTVAGHPLSSNVSIGLADLTEDVDHRFVSDAEKADWNTKVTWDDVNADFVGRGDISVYLDSNASDAKYITPSVTRQLISDSITAAKSPHDLFVVADHLTVWGRDTTIPGSIDTLVGIWPTLDDLGIEQIDNTSDLDKPISTATQTALNLKAPLANPTFTGTPLVPTPDLSDSSNKIANTDFVQSLIASYKVPKVIVQDGTSQFPVSGDSTDNPLGDWIIPGHTIGINGSYRITGVISFSGTAYAKTVLIKLNTTTVYTMVVPANSLSASFSIPIYNQNAYDSQIVPANLSTGGSATANATFSIDTSNDVNISIQTNTASSSSSTLEEVQVIAIY